MTNLLVRPNTDGALTVTPQSAGWEYIHFSARHIADGQTLSGNTEDRETALILLSGRATITAAGRAWTNIGSRKDVWERVPPYTLLLPPGVPYTVQAVGPLHIAIAAAPADGGLAPRLITPEEMTVEERGEGQTYRYIHHLLPPRAQARRLLLVEVYTPGGNWSSFPPHKHDTEDPPREAYLEEVYYHLVNPAPGFAVQRVYTDDRSVDQTISVHSGDLVLVPRGYHPVAATPGHYLYYLNVMAGHTREWNFAADPDYAHLMNWKKHHAMGGT